MKLTSVYDHPDRHDLLYSLLAERSEDASISHRRMPCFGDHIRFVEAKPYQAWYFVSDPEPVGAVYLTANNEIGIAVFAKHQKKGYGRRAVQALMKEHGPRRYLANINPRNEASRFLFAGLGFNLIQHTYATEA